MLLQGISKKYILRFLLSSTDKIIRNCCHTRSPEMGFMHSISIIFCTLMSILIMTNQIKCLDSMPNSKIRPKNDIREMNNSQFIKWLNNYFQWKRWEGIDPYEKRWSDGIPFWGKRGRDSKEAMNYL